MPNYHGQSALAEETLMPPMDGAPMLVMHAPNRQSSRQGLLGQKADQKLSSLWCQMRRAGKKHRTGGHSLEKG